MEQENRPENDRLIISCYKKEKGKGNERLKNYKPIVRNG